MKRFYLILFFISVSYMLFSQLTIDGEIRPRSEFRNGYNKTQSYDGLSPEYLTSQRTALGVLYTQNNIIGKITFQDVRTWGESEPKKDSATLHLKEAWIAVPIGDAVIIIAGRQIIKYDNQRILAWTNWNQIGTQHDIVQIQYKKDKLQAHLGLGYNNESAGDYGEDYYPVPYYKSLQYLWINYKFSDNMSTSLLSVADINAKNDTKDTYYARFTYGGTLKYNPIESLNTNTTFYYQSGRTPTGIEVGAYMFTTRLDYSLMEKAGIFAGLDLYSGHDPNNAPKKSNFFDRLYGAKHKYLGYMDYFPTNKNGIMDIFGGINYKAGKKLSAELGLHTFMLPHDFTNPDDGEKLDSYLGFETDIAANYKIAKSLKLSFIYGMLFGTKSMDVVKGGDHKTMNNFAMLMLTFKPSFKFNPQEEEKEKIQ